MPRKKPSKIEVGDVFGHNEVLGQLDERYISPNGKSQIQWKFQCLICGVEKVATTSNINGGRMASCRCQSYSEEMVRKRADSNIKYGCGAKEVYRDYARNASKRGIEFNITLAEATKMFKSDCYYCGAAPNMVKKRASLDYLYNGIDRLDNKKVYTPTTTVPCCKTCNRIKHVLPEEDFIQHIRNIITHYDREQPTTDR